MLKPAVAALAQGRPDAGDADAVGDQIVPGGAEMSLDRRSGLRRLDIAFGAILVLSLGWWLWLARDMSFFYDEWSFIPGADDWSLATFLDPHNEHWSLVPKLIYQSLMATVGMRSYVPYIVVLLLFHGLTATALYWYARGRVHPAITLGATAIFLLLGSGAENLLWGFQVGFTAAAAMGTWALVLLLREPSRRSAAIAAVLLMIAVATAGVALFFVASATFVLLVAAPLRRYLWAVAPAIVLYAAWFLTYGADATREAPDAAELIEFVSLGMVNTAGQVSGLGQWVGAGIVILLGLSTVWLLLRRGALPLALIAGLVGLTAQFVVTGLARAGSGPAEGALASRYVYVGAIFVIIALLGWVEGLPVGRPARRAVVPLGMAVLLLFGIAWNVGQMLEQRDRFGAWADQYRATIHVLTTYGGTDAIPDEQGMAAVPGGTLRVALDDEEPLVPGAAGLRALIARYGSPLRDELLGRTFDIPDAALDRVFTRLLADGFVILPLDRPAGTRPPTVDAASAVDVHAEAECLRVEPAGDDPWVSLRTPSGTALYLESDRAGRGSIGLSVRGAFAAEQRTFAVRPGTATRIGLPDIGPERDLHVRIVPLPAGTTRLCLALTEPAGSVPARAFDVRDLIVRATEAAPTRSPEPEVFFSNSVEVAVAQDGCLTVAAVGPDPYLSLRVPDGQRLFAEVAPGGRAQVFLDAGWGYSEDQSLRLTMEEGVYEIFMPPGSAADGWPIRVDPPDDQQTRLCLGVSSSDEAG